MMDDDATRPAEKATVPPPSSLFDDDEYGEDEATVMARIPDELLAESQRAEEARGGGGLKQMFSREGAHAPPPSRPASPNETEGDALEEEAEAKRLQQKKLQKMSEADFGFDESEWLDAGDDEEGDDVVTEVLKDVESTPDMTPEDRLRILHTRYPEFEFLANEFLQLQPVLQDLQQEAETEATSKTSGASVCIR